MDHVKRRGGFFILFYLFFWGSPLRCFVVPFFEHAENWGKHVEHIKGRFLSKKTNPTARGSERERCLMG